MESVHFSFGQCVVNLVATLLISKHCIFIFTPRYGGISHAISLSTRGVPEKKLVTFFFLHDLKEKNIFQKPLNIFQCHFDFLECFSQVLCLHSQHYHFPSSSVFPSLVNSYPPFKTQFNCHFPQPSQKHMLFSPAHYCCLYIVVDDPWAHKGLGSSCLFWLCIFVDFYRARFKVGKWVNVNEHVNEWMVHERVTCGRNNTNSPLWHPSPTMECHFWNLTQSPHACDLVSDLPTRYHWPVCPSCVVISFCNYRHLAIWSDVFSYILLTQNYHGLCFSSLFFHTELRVILSTFVESTTERRFLLKLRWIYRFIQFRGRLINLPITLGIAIHEHRISPHLCP